MKQIVFLVYSDNIFTQIYIEELLKVEKLRIKVIGFQKTRRLKFYKKNNIEYIYMPREPQMSNYIQCFRALMFMYANRGRFDFVHVHIVNEVTLKYAKLLAGKKGKLILTYWGGDIYSKPHETFMREKNYLDDAYKMNVMTDDMKSILNREYNFRFDKKCRIVNFGNSTLRYIDKYLNQYGKERLKRIARKSFGMPKDKVVIAIGYCGRTQQQHIKVIKQIRNYPEEVKRSIFLYCHMAYDVANEYYMRQVKFELNKCGCQYAVNDEYLSTSKIAVMKMGVDIFVHAGKYDAISDSMLEYIYAGKKVLNPSWIEYKIFEEKGIQDIKYNDFNELGEKLLQAIENPCWPLLIEEQNRKKVAEISSWDSLLPQWLELYE